MATVALAVFVMCSGCSALPTVAGFMSGGVTVYKSAKEYGPKAEIVVFKFQHDNYVTNASNPVGATNKCVSCSPSRARAKVSQ